MNIIDKGEFNVRREVKDIIEPFVFEYTISKNGSISAEHGLGRCKNEYLGKYAKDAATVAIMKTMKQSFDPNGILNPCKFLPST